MSDRGQVALWGLASGIMVSASMFGLVMEGLAEASGHGSGLSGRSYRELTTGVTAGVLVMVPLMFV